MKYEGYTLLILEEHQALTLDLDVILLLVVLADSGALEVVCRVLFFLPLLLLLLLLRSPNLIDVEELNSNNIAFQRTVAILGTTNINIGVQHLSRDIGVRAITFVDT